MKYLSICSGVDSCSLAWTQTPDGKGLGWEPVGFSEIEKFPSAVLKHHYPDVPNLGDMTRFREWPDRIFEEANLIVGGRRVRHLAMHAKDDHSMMKEET